MASPLDHKRYPIDVHISEQPHKSQLGMSIALLKRAGPVAASAVLRTQCFARILCGSWCLV